MPFGLNRLSNTGLIRTVAEVVLLLLIAWSPWPFGSYQYAWEAVLTAGIVLICLLWLAYSFFQAELRVRPDHISICLAGLALTTALQLVPLPEGIVKIISLMRVQLHRELLPAQQELLPGETAVAPRSTWLPITVDPFLTRTLLAQLLTVLLLYFAVRSWLASRNALQRFAWVATANGILLAIFGLTQFFTSPNHVIFWSVETGGAVFGPFVCKNHYPDYVLFCLGLGFGLMLSRQGPGTVSVRGVQYRLGLMARLGNSPDLFVIAIGLMLVVASIPFTLSRGGLLAAIAAAIITLAIGLRTRRSISGGLIAIGVIVSGAMLLGSWYGWGIVSERLDSLRSAVSTDTRRELWRDTRKLVPEFLFAGGGGGAFGRFEPIVRTDPRPEFHEMDNAHNEYLEALLEGGLVRLGLTLALCFYVLRTTLRAYHRLIDRSSGPIILGIFYGQLALMIHSVVDFGIHIPAVALIATVATAFAAHAATDESYVPFKKKSGAEPERDRGRRVFRGPVAYLCAVILAGLGAWLLDNVTRRGLGEELKNVDREIIGGNALKYLDMRLEVLQEAVRVTPDDGVAWSLLAQARLEASEQAVRTAAMALAGGPCPWRLPPDLLIRPSSQQARDGLAAARQARNLSPLLTRPHWFLALYQAGFAQSEPARTHFDRAVRTCATDARLRIDRGREAADRGDLAAAIADWQRAMSLDFWVVPRVLEVAERYLAADQILSPLLPSDPIVITMAMEQLHPRWKSGVESARQPFLRKIAGLDGRGDWTARGWMMIAKAHAELGDTAAAEAAWKNMLQRDPNSFELRNQMAQWYEETERYAEAEEQLAWLRAQHDSRELRDRFDAVRHARKLQDIIQGRR